MKPEEKARKEIDRQLKMAGWEVQNYNELNLGARPGVAVREFPLQPASVLLERIKEERKKKAGGKFKELPLVDTTDLPKLPESWEWTYLDVIAEKITDGEHIRPQVVKKGVYFLSAKDIRNEGVNFDDPLFVSSEDAQRFRKRCDPEYGDLLVVSRGATVGRSCIVKTKAIFCLLGSVILIKPFKEMDKQFISYILKSPFLQEGLVKLSGATAQQAIYIRDIRNQLIPIPPLFEQFQIVSEIEARLSMADEVEKVAEQTLGQSERLRQSILKNAFEGKLVAQDPTDEPVEKLLERIKAE